MNENENIPQLPGLDEVNAQIAFDSLKGIRVLLDGCIALSLIAGAAGVATEEASGVLIGAGSFLLSSSARVWNSRPLVNRREARRNY